MDALKDVLQLVENEQLPLQKIFNNSNHAHTTLPSNEEVQNSSNISDDELSDIIDDTQYKRRKTYNGENSKKNRTYMRHGPNIKKKSYNKRTSRYSHSR